MNLCLKAQPVPKALLGFPDKLALLSLTAETLRGLLLRSGLSPSQTPLATGGLGVSPPTPPKENLSILFPPLQGCPLGQSKSIVLGLGFP